MSYKSNTVRDSANGEYRFKTTQGKPPLAGGRENSVGFREQKQR